ncbi:fibronectin type III domain-containing protein [Butyrivibrio sp. AE3004]|uniref:fibronectin type III domain-containing protein n=1 Tax=Butyrivibrio sp. AE3004 TaxID=1506994 RepID=UPI0004947AD6|nr:fibronectin type III domain-containing protein [Butyrivibrio sp. AE3004]
MRKNKNLYLKQYMLFLLMFLCFLMFSEKRVSAAVSAMTQSKLSAESATVNWTKVSGAKEYYLGIGVNENDAKTAVSNHMVVVSADTIHYTFTNLNPGMRYYVVLRYLYEDKDGVKKEEQAGSMIMKTVPSKISGLTQARWYNNQKKVYVTWNEQPAGTYRYVFMDKNGKRIKAGELLSNSFSTRIDNNKCYSFKVKSVAVINGKTYESVWSDRIYLFAQPMIKSYNYGNDFDLTIKGGRLELKWDRVKYADAGYRIHISRNRDKDYVSAGTVSRKKSSAVVKRYKGHSFKRSETYYVYVEGLRKYGGQISSTGIGYVWEYKNGRVRKTYYHGKY